MGREAFPEDCVRGLWHVKLCWKVTYWCYAFGKMFDTPPHCGRVWSTSVSILKCTLTWRVCQSAFFFFFSFFPFRALQYTYLYPVKTEQMSGCLNVLKYKENFVPTCSARLRLFYLRRLRRGESPAESAAGSEGQKNPTGGKKKKLRATAQPRVVPAPGIGPLNEHAGAPAARWRI